MLKHDKAATKPPVFLHVVTPPTSQLRHTMKMLYFPFSLARARICLCVRRDSRLSLCVRMCVHTRAQMHSLSIRLTRAHGLLPVGFESTLVGLCFKMSGKCESASALGCRRTRPSDLQAALKSSRCPQCPQWRWKRQHWHAQWPCCRCAVPCLSPAPRPASQRCPCPCFGPLRQTLRLLGAARLALSARCPRWRHRWAWLRAHALQRGRSRWGADTP